MPLPGYHEIPNEYRQNLLLGNGFSVGIHTGFAYPSLYKICSEGYGDNPPYFDEKDIELFNKCETTDFEFVLRQLNIARTVNLIYEIPSILLNNRYRSIRNALIEAVRLTHPFAAQLPAGLLPQLHRLLSTFKNIFSLNYDLLCYWAIMVDVGNFIDFYFQGNSFDSLNVGVRNINAICIYYLHGALHLYRDEFNTYKTVSRGSLLLDFTELITEQHTPLFISEGTSAQKLSLIGSNDYLSFCFSSLMKSRGYMTIHGASLNLETDSHISRAINLSDVTHIAYGIHQPDGNEEKIMEKKNRITAMFRDKYLVFYDSDTFL